MNLPSIYDDEFEEVTFTAFRTLFGSHDDMSLKAKTNLYNFSLEMVENQGMCAIYHIEYEYGDFVVLSLPYLHHLHKYYCDSSLPILSMRCHYCRKHIEK